MKALIIMQESVVICSVLLIE